MSPDSGLASRRSKKSGKTDNKTATKADIKTETSSRRITKKIKLPYAFGPIGIEVYQRTYSRLKSDGKPETWPETVRRVVDGNLAFVDARFHEKDEREKLYDLILKMNMIPAGRHLWVTGVPGRQYVSNCHSAGWLRKDLTEHFTFTFDELMKGGGVGSNYSNRYIGIYPPVFDKVELHVVCNPSHPNIDEFKRYLSPMYDHLVHNRYVVDDSREGWWGSLAEVLRAAWDGKDGPLIIDVSMLRERGALLKSFGGRSSGPGPLVALLNNVAKILNAKIGQKLTSLDFMEIDHQIAACVVSGNIRRSARMSIKHWADPDIFEFIRLKKTEKNGDEKKHWSTNISVEVDDAFFRALRKGEQHASKVLQEVAEGMHHDGEPGFWNSSLSAVGEVDHPFTTNPCAEIAFGPWDVCCLGHINLERFANRDTEAREAFRLMTRFLVRATFGDIMNPLQKEVIHKNRRIGVGFFGFHPWLVYQGVRFSESHHKKHIREKLKGFYDLCRETANTYAFQLRIPAPIKVTCVAPTGTISNLPGTTSGCQPVFAKYFIRRVVFPKDDPQIGKYEAQGYKVEEYVYDDHKNSRVVAFPCKDPLMAGCEEKGVDPSFIEEQAEVSVSDHLAVQAMLQDEFADNCISYTINFDPTVVTVDDIKTALRIHLPHLKGTTMMPEIHGRPQSPLERISKEDFEKSGIGKVSDAERGCNNGSCPIK